MPQQNTNKLVLVGLSAVFLLAIARRVAPAQGPKPGGFPLPAGGGVPLSTVPSGVMLPGGGSAVMVGVPSAAARRVCYPVSPWSAYYVATGYLGTGAGYGGRTDFHTGSDINLKSGGDSDRGKPIYCAAEGVVVHVGSTLKGWGHFVVIQHQALGVWTRYAHMETAPLVKQGQAVKLGQQIGSIGKSGGQQYTHLHFDVITHQLSNWADWPGADRARVVQNYTDPLKWLAQVGAQDRTRLGL